MIMREASPENVGISPKEGRFRIVMTHDASAPAADPYVTFEREHPAEAERVRKLVNEGRYYLERGDSDEARARFVKALAVFPLVPSALTNLAALAIHQENLDQAWYYLSQVLENFPKDPAAHAVAARYWLQRGSHPNVYRHGRAAVTSLTTMAQRAKELADPSVFDRARRIVVSTLALFQADLLLVEVHAALPNAEWDEATTTMFGIAHFNVGEYPTAAQLWRSVASSVDESPAGWYLSLLELLETRMVVPFHLDYNLEARLPSEDELRRAIETHLTPDRPLRLVAKGADEVEDEEETAGEDLIQALRMVARPIPSVAVAAALRRLAHGDDDEAELALAILFFERWPFLEQVLRYIASSGDFSTRLQLNGALYLLWTSGPDESLPILKRFDLGQMDEVEVFIAHIIWIQVSLATKDLASARKHEAEAQRLVGRVQGSVYAWTQVLTELSLRIDQMAREWENRPGERERPSGVGEDAAPPGVEKVVPFIRRRTERNEP